LLTALTGFLSDDIHYLIELLFWNGDEGLGLNVIHELI
jgi:hypothetical protein